MAFTGGKGPHVFYPPVLEYLNRYLGVSILLPFEDHAQ